MPYIRKEYRNSQVLESPRSRGELNWAITTRLLLSFQNTPRGYNEHCEYRSMIEEILQSIIMEKSLVRRQYTEYADSTRSLMKDVDELVWDYLARTGDTAGAKQVLRDVVLEWYRRKTSLYEDMKKQENGDLY